MEFDIVIPTKDRPEDLKRLIDSIDNSTKLPKNVIIVDQSFNVLSKIVSNKYNVNHIHAKNITGLCDAKNLGVSFCKSDIIHFFDDDIIVDPDYFEIINRHFEQHPEYCGICGRQKNSKSSIIKIVAFSFFHIGSFKDIRKKCNSGYVKKPLVETNILPGGITAYKRIVFDSFKFDDVLIKYCLGEDMDFSYRVSKKFRLAFATNALALHNHSQIGRYDPLESFACKMAGYSYFYKKNLTSSFLDRFAYTMVLCGVIFDAMSYTFSHRDMDALKGIRKGLHYVRHKFEGVPFIDSKRIAFKL